MNANELADELEVHEFTSDFLYVREVVDILRQQQEKIDKLMTIAEDYQKIIVKLKQDNKELHAIAQRMAMAESDARKSLQNIKDHSAELTDEEILELWIKNNHLKGAEGIVDFARAILRKAQEK